MGKLETVSDYFFGFQNHYRWWLQPWNKKTLTPWKESYDQPRYQIQKQRHYFANKVPSSQGYGFSSSTEGFFMYGCESWTVKKAERWKLMLLNCGIGEDSWVPWTARRSNQSILKEISPEYSLEGLTLKLKLKLQFFGHLMWRANSLEKTLTLGEIGRG